jgi:hypothetical protein
VNLLLARQVNFLTKSPQQVLEVGDIEGRRGMHLDGRKVSVTDGAWVGLLTECCARGVNVGITIDVTAEGGAPHEPDSVRVGKCHHVTHIQTLPTKYGDELTQSDGSDGRRHEVVVGEGRASRCRVAMAQRHILGWRVEL